MKQLPWLLVIGKNIKKQRKMKRLTQEALALQANIGLSYFGKIERGEHNFSIKCLLKIASVLDIDPSIFMPTIKDMDIKNLFTDNYTD